MKYEVGDRVRIKDIGWFNKNKSKSHGTIACGDKYFEYDMKEWCGKIMTILEVYQTCYIMQEDGAKDLWTDEMFECKVEEETKSKFKVGDKVILDPYPCIVTDVHWRDSLHRFVYTVRGTDFGMMVGEEDLIFDTSEETYDFLKTDKSNKPSLNDCMGFLNNEITLPQGYQFKDENGNVINAQKIVLEKKKKEYPKTYEECCKILGFLNVDLCFNADYRSFHASKEQWKRLGLMNQFYQLLICRNAYWKIAGEEMGLGKPWEPDGNPVYAITRNDGCIVYMETGGNDEVFEFPTPEMRDAFKENFDPDIEICKKLL